jgi:hypothetical protein
VTTTTQRVALEKEALYFCPVPQGDVTEILAAVVSVTRKGVRSTLSTVS